MVACRSSASESKPSGLVRKLGRSCHAAHSPTPVRNYNYHYTVGRGTLADAVKDWRWCAAEGRRSEWPHAVAVRFAQRLGKRDGYHAGWKHYQRDAS